MQPYAKAMIGRQIAFVIAQLPLIFLQLLLGAFWSRDDVALFNYPDVHESCAIRNLRLRPFGSLAKNPLAHIGRAVNQYNTPVLAGIQESYNLNVHKSDFTQVQEHANAVIVHLSPYVTDIGRLNSTTEPQARSVSVRLLFNPQHWSTIALPAKITEFAQIDPTSPTLFVLETDAFIDTTN